MKSTTKKRNYQVSLVGNTRAKDQRRSLEGPASRKWIILLYKKFQTLHALRKLLLEEKLFSDVFFLTSIDGFSQISQIHKFSFFKTIHSRLGKRNSVNFHREVGIDKFLKKKKTEYSILRQFNKEITKRKVVEKKTRRRTMFHKSLSFIFHDLESAKIGVQGYRQYTVIWLNILSPEEKKMTRRVPPRGYWAMIEPVT